MKNVPQEKNGKGAPLVLYGAPVKKGKTFFAATVLGRGFPLQPHFTANQVKQDSQYDKWNESKYVGIFSGRKRIRFCQE